MNYYRRKRDRGGCLGFRNVADRQGSQSVKLAFDAAIETSVLRQICATHRERRLSSSVS